MKSVKKYLFLLPLVLFFTASREFLLRPFWFDESLTLMNFALLPLEKIYTSYFIPNNHIGYTMLLHIWYFCMPQNVAPDVWCRILSFLFGSAFLLFSWMVFKRWVFRTALCCFAVSMPFLIYATSVRGYMAALFFSMIVVHCACRFAAECSLKNGLLLFVSSLCCVSVLPSNLFLLGSAVVYAVPLCGKKFYCRKNFYLLSAVPLAAFIVFWFPLWPLLIKASQLGEGWQNRWHSLAAGVVSYCACTALIVLAALLKFVAARKKFEIKDIRLLSFFAILPLVFFAKVAPFPRVYFPFFGIFMLVTSDYAARTLALVRTKKIMKFPHLKIVFAAAALGTALFLNHSAFALDLLSKCNGAKERDDYFTPWYIAKSHVPDKTAKTIAASGVNYCYLSFSSDPWSVMFYSALNGTGINKFHFDGPQGRVETLPDGAFAVINKNESVEGLIKRFGGKFELLYSNAMHKVFRYGF